jgi:hypothetical protein
MIVKEGQFEGNQLERKGGKEKERESEYEMEVS